MDDIELEEQIPKKKKIKYKNIFRLIFILIIISFSIYYILNLKIKNIYISGNKDIVDQDIIDASGLRNYPKIISISKSNIKKKLLDNKYIDKANIKIDYLKQSIEIEIEENIPVLYYSYDDSYLLSNGSKISDKKYNLPVLINQTPDLILKKLLKKLSVVDKDILERISEIKYSPSKVDEELFVFTMSDGNYVYINFNSIKKINDYVDYLKSLKNKKGILHLDSGDYLEVFEKKK